MFEGNTIKVIMPALNEAASIGKVLDAVSEWVDEIIVVDNGSTDETAARASRGGATVVTEPRRGYGYACLAGMDAVGWCDVVVFLDADFSDYPDQMDRLVGPIVRGEADMVIGSRTLGDHPPDALTPPQRFGTALACGLMNLLWRTRHTDLGPFRAVRWSALRSLGMCDRTYGWTIEMQIKAARGGLRVREVPVSYRRRIGVSKISGTVRGMVGAGYKILTTIGRYALSPAPRPVAADRLIIFTRYPRPGQAKTRLVPAMGAEAAADLQRRMTEETLETAKTARARIGGEIEIRYADGGEKEIARWLGSELRYAAQEGDDLGDRMRRAFADALDAGCRRVVIIGTDCPEMSSRDLTDAFDALAYHDMVLGPSADGGYWLIGLRRPADVFRGVAWSTESVLPQTLALAEQAGLSVKSLETRADVDTPEDLERLRRDRPDLIGR